MRYSADAKIAMKLSAIDIRHLSVPGEFLCILECSLRVFLFRCGLVTAIQPDCRVLLCICEQWARQELTAYSIFRNTYYNQKLFVSWLVYSC